MLVLLPTLNSQSPIYTLGWREALWDYSFLPKNTKQLPKLGLESRTTQSAVQRTNHQAPVPPSIYTRVKFPSATQARLHYAESWLRNCWFRKMYCSWTNFVITNYLLYRAEYALHRKIRKISNLQFTNVIETGEKTRLTLIPAHSTAMGTKHCTDSPRSTTTSKTLDNLVKNEKRSKQT